MEEFKASCSNLLNSREKLSILDKKNDGAVFKVINHHPIR